MRPTHPRPRILRRRTTSASPAAIRPRSAAGILLVPLPLAILCLVGGSGCDPQVGAGQAANGQAASTTAPGIAAAVPARASTPTNPPVPAPTATADRGGPAHPMAAPITAPAPSPTSVPPPATTAPPRDTGGSPTHNDPAPPPPASRPNATTAPPAPATPTRVPAAASPAGGYPAGVVAKTNEQRRAAGCPALSIDPVLTAVAQAHSADMALAAYFSHDSPDGRGPFDRITAAGFAFSAAAENIAAGQSDPSAVLQAWMNSPGHRANIVNCGLTRIGVGVATGGPYGTYWTQDFATPAR
ncbi:CAP domain-containing protein [Frankia sp. AgKG'84/4]|uniref:CAP domain-containing protein n=1 Tax=Frankia sp. AgKG'84/4 TaxID=573490 RepID=UPI00202AA42D|nr:CAP domain-containing protein [Frankia sp. AgKG'84/4]MCL9794830.1 CAP domain-containing protein [Frankia sp. AgKG'84/4]